MVQNPKGRQILSDTVYISDIVLLLIPLPERTSVTLQRDSVTHNTIFPFYM